MYAAVFTALGLLR